MRPSEVIEQRLRDAESGTRDVEELRMLRAQLATAQRRERGVVGVTDVQMQSDPFAPRKAPEPPRPGGHWVTRSLSTGTVRVWVEEEPT